MRRSSLQNRERVDAVCSRSPRRRTAAPIPYLLAPILFGLSACDNVQWGGNDIEIIPPPPSDVLAVEAPDEETSVRLGLPTGPVLFHVIKGAQGSTLFPVGELSGDSLRNLSPGPEADATTFQQRFIETVLPTGSSFRLFRRGAPVGTFVTTGVGQPTPCGLPTAVGNATVVAAAADANEFIAFAEGLSPEVRGQYNPPQINGSINTYASIVAEKLILQAGLPRPRSWAGAQRDLDALEILPGGHPEMSATYLVGDSLAAGPADPQGYSVFYVADYETATGYNPIYTEVRNYSRTGKQAPAIIDYLDWNGQPGPEILVRVFGRDQAWYEALSQRGDRWEKVWEGGRC